ncbi:MAG: TAT-variant-translocated molybdopterin oxidoreductase [Flavobacteriaceae bacterium]|nr:TAT-variant-translocated molybdopterin oxidoreductase [Flavobacteriaceae bacterium]
MASNKKYWKSVEELNPNSSIVETLKHKEFVNEIPVDDFLGDKENLAASSTTRRDFLKYVGFSTAAASLAACEGPVIKSVPYVVQPESVIPGVADYYATTIANGYDFASVLVKAREGRPILMMNNQEAEVNGSANARVMASVLDLYDSRRVQGPKTAGASTNWEAVHKAVKEGLTSGKEVVFLTQTYASPSMDRLMSAFKAKFPTVKHITYDAIAEDATLDAFEAKYGTRAMPDYDFEKSDVIVSVGADFIADWNGGGYDASYAKGRIPKNGKMSKHYQIESNMSLAGANADVRVLATPAEQKVALAKIYALLSGATVGGTLNDKAAATVKKAVASLKKAGSKGVVVTGLQDKDAQMLALEINALLQSDVIDVEAPKLTRQGDSKKVNELVADMNAGKVGMLVMDGVNPAYSLPNAAEFKTGLEKTPSVCFSMKADETAVQATFIAARPHYLESWGDVEMKSGSFALQQPVIRPLFDTMQLQDAMLHWMEEDKSYYDFVKETWSAGILAGAQWEKALHDGFFKNTQPVVAEEQTETETPAVVAAVDAVEEEVVAPSSAMAIATKLSKAVAGKMSLILYVKTGMGDGQQANNPWLQEFPDPISRVSWDNYVTMSKADAAKLGIENWHVADGGLDGHKVKMTVGGVSVTAPVLIQPGQAPRTIGFSFGYGKKEGVQEEMQTGKNAFELYQDFNTVQDVQLEAVMETHEFACVQLHNTLMGRNDVLKETTLADFNTKQAAEWNKKPVVSLNHNEVEATSVSLWDEFDRTIGHHFNLSIDLNACTGCGACVIACHAENNVPVVGKEEVRKSRDMHWLRIDRYYSSNDTFEGDNEQKHEIDGLFGEHGSLGEFGEMEDPSENPQVAFQPVMCQHCNHAPCETVCPVAATSHGRQGQNHMAYNRCVGTRYCANNCPYKVRRFNWFLYNNNDEFDYNMNNDLGKMVLNPDVVVRSRGVMEKCSFCIQATQAVILKAKREGRPVAKGEFNDACACSAACGSGAMVFGDINEKDSKIAACVEDDRAYHLLEHVGTLPNVVYQVKVRNTNEA